VSYRHLLVIKGFPDGQLDCTPPHDITGKRFAEYLPQGAGSGQLQQLMLRARDVLAQSEINRRRRSEGNTPATDIWLWGHGAAASFPTLRDRYNLTGSVITAVDLVRGLGQLAGLTIRNVEGATGYLDTNYAGKLSAAIDALRDQDFVYLHIEAPDETSHEGSKKKKLQAIEDFDTRIVGRARAAIDALGDWRILVVPDHATLLSTMTHHAMAVPYCLSGKNIEQDEATTYSESAAAGKPLHTGPSLFERFIRE
jgi:2,3-bisphosphoglycerate-independent phosphoglycerate mutase